MAVREVELRRVPVARVMTRGPATVEEAAPLADAAAEMAAGGFRHVPVVDRDGRLVGMVSERDLRARLGTDVHGFSAAAADALVQPVSEVMTPDPIALPPAAPLADALAVFADERVGAVPIVDASERPVGILSYVDLLRTIRDLSEIVAKREAATRARAPRESPVARTLRPPPRRRRTPPHGRARAAHRQSRGQPGR